MKRMRSRRTVAVAMIVLMTVVVGSVGPVGAQPATDESYWGETMVNGIFHTWPAVAIAVFAAFVSGGMLGFYELDRTTVVVLLAIITFLVYHFYWRPSHAASSELRSPPTPRARRTTLLSTS
jgi:hypothetical protein